MCDIWSVQFSETHSYIVPVLKSVAMKRLVEIEDTSLCMSMVCKV
jgi:hypothetical protein